MQTICSAIAEKKHALVRGPSAAATSRVSGARARRVGGPRGPGGWWILTEVEVSYADTDEVYRHDVVGFRRDRHDERPAGMPVTARPDWVCEILSPSTARRDLVTEPRTLHVHGVPHHWVIDPEHETLRVFRHGPDGYIDVLTAGREDVVPAEPFDAIEIDVGEIFGHERA